MKRFYKHIAGGIVLFLLFAGLLTNCMLNNIAGTDTILHDDYKYLSLVNGAIAWETGVIRRLYDFGQIFPVYGQDKQGRKIIENYENLDQTHKMVRLIHALFYRVPGSTGETDFGATIQLASEDQNVTVPLVAAIIVQCIQLQQQRELFKNAVAYVKDEIIAFLTQDQLAKLGKKITQASLEQKIKDVLLKPWNNQASSAFTSMCKSFIKNLARELGQEKIQKIEAHQQMADNFFNMITQITNNLIKLFKPVVFKKNDRVESIIEQALNESDPNNPDALYPPHTVEMVLLAFVYKKYSYDRNVLKAFYNELNMQLGGKALLYSLNEQWVKDSFTAVTQAEALKHIEAIFAAQDLMENIKQHFAEFVYSALQIRIFPAPVGYAKATYEYEQGKKTPEFPDCMDNAMRNFINLYAYDAKQNKFMLTKLQETLGIKEVGPKLASFLDKFGDVNMASSFEAHNAWVDIVAHIPYVAYRQMVDATTGVATRATAAEGYFGKGYIVIPKDEQNNTLLNWLKNNEYQVINTNQYNCELRASLKNIIIVLDNLLSLNLFSDAGGLAKEFMRLDFTKEYFSKLCSALKATGYVSTQSNAKQGELGKDFDALDYTAITIYTTIDIAKIICQFKTYSGHGELQLVTIEGGRTLVTLLEKINDFMGQPSLSLLVTNLLCKQDINSYHFTKISEYLYINLFAASLENTGLITENNFGLIFSFQYSTFLKKRIDITNLLLRLAEEQPDTRLKQTLKFLITRLCINSISDDDMKHGGTDLTRFFKEATQAAVKGITDQNPDVRLRASSLFNALVEKKQAFTEATQAAEKGITDQDPNVRSQAINLFRALIKKNQAFKEATQAAAKGITDQNPDVRSIALDLFNTLVEKDQAFTEATQAAEKGITDQDPNVRLQAINLFRALIKKNQVFKEATQAAAKGVTDQDSDVSYLSLDLFMQLMLKVPNETKQEIQKLLNDPNLNLADDLKKNLAKLIR